MTDAGGWSEPVSRALWRRLETLHAVTYFAEESRSAAKACGLRGFWMGYFGFRAAPLGAVSPATVEATFGSFSPHMVRRAIPDAWDHAAPDELVTARADAARDALARLAPDLDDRADDVNPLLERVVAAASPLGRPLFAANAALNLPDDPVARLWQLATTIREHRGDGHLHALAGAGLDGCEAHLVHAAEFDTPDDVLQVNRGWSDDEWADAIERLNARGVLERRQLTEVGWALRRQVESDTDRSASRPIDAALDDSEQRHLLDVLAPPAHDVARSGTIPFPNPMGLQRFDR